MRRRPSTEPDFEEDDSRADVSGEIRLPPTLERSDALSRRKRADGLCGEEAVQGCGRAVEHDVNVSIARGPQIFEQRCSEGFGQRRRQCRLRSGADVRFSCDRRGNA